MQKIVLVWHNVFGYFVRHSSWSVEGELRYRNTLYTEKAEIVIRIVNRNTAYVLLYTRCFYSMTRFQQAIKGASLKISTCGLLQIVGTEKMIFFFIYDTWRYKTNCGNASDLKKSSENRKHLVLWKSYTYLQICFFNLLVINCHKNRDKDQIIISDPIK